jgi:heme exporter protein C
VTQIAAPLLRPASSVRAPSAALLAAVAAVTLLTATALALYWVPADADQGFSQRIFYLHVPNALTAYVCFAVGAWKAVRLLATGDERYDLESHTAVHIGVVYAVLTLATGSIWARVSWGVWWTWSENQLVLFLVVFLFYCAYFMLRYSVAAGPQRARLAAVYALFGIVLMPISFLAIRLSASFIHPVVFTTHGPQMAGSMFLVFCLSLAGLGGLAAALYRTELAGRRLDRRLRELRSAR